MSEVVLTDRAARRIAEIMAAEPAGSMLRISVNGGGCSGFQYAFDVDQARQDDDIVIEKRRRTGAGRLDLAGVHGRLGHRLRGRFDRAIVQDREPPGDRVLRVWDVVLALRVKSWPGLHPPHSC